MKVYPKRCELCGRNIANKKNSHIIPSFIMCNFSSSDGTGKRNHELTYSVGKIIKVYTGNEVPMEVMEETFDDLSEERLDNELKQNDIALDDVFCPSCEKALADYLESPYSQYYSSGRKIQPQEQYFFWVSVLWRVSHFRILKASLPKFIATELRKSLDGYLSAKVKNEEYEEPNCRYHVRYRILRCEEYKKNSRGSAYVEYDKGHRVYSMSLGDLMVCFTFDDDVLPDDYNFLGIGNEFRDASINDGTSQEACKYVSEDVFNQAYDTLVQIAQKDYIQNEVKMLHELWRECQRRGFPMPLGSPSDVFVQRCLQHIHDEKKKLGERHTYVNSALSFADTLEEVYGVKVYRIHK